jgi:Rieske Fe-S protein
MMSHNIPATTPPTRPGRRRLLQWLGGLSTVLGSAALGVPFLGYLLGPLLPRFKHQEDQWIDLGPVDDFPLHQTRLAPFKNPFAHPWDGETNKGTAYVRRVDGDDIHVFAIYCTHLGCPVSWFQESGLFLCPCHGGAYYETGERASGPPPQGLYEYKHKIDERRHLWIKGGHLPTLQDPA